MSNIPIQDRLIELADRLSPLENRVQTGDSNLVMEAQQRLYCAWKDVSDMEAEFAAARAECEDAKSVQEAQERLLRDIEQQLAAARAENVTRNELMLATYEAGQTELAAVYAQLREVVVLLSNHMDAGQIPITVFKRIKAKLEESR